MRPTRDHDLIRTWGIRNLATPVKVLPLVSDGEPTRLHFLFGKGVVGPPELRLNMYRKGRCTSQMSRQNDADTSRMRCLAWWSHQDLNLEPTDYKSNFGLFALSCTERHCMAKRLQMCSLVPRHVLHDVARNCTRFRMQQAPKQALRLCRGRHLEAHVQVL